MHYFNKEELLKDYEQCKNLSTEEMVKALVNMGFSCKRYYTATAWNYATKVLNRACKLKLAYPFDFGRGKGKFSSENSIKTVAQELSTDSIALEIASKYHRYLLKQYQKELTRFEELERMV